jgi:hypothetical protein
MAKTPSKRPSRKPKPTRAALARAIKKHLPNIQDAAEKALQAAGLHDLAVHSMTFSVKDSAVTGYCSPPCKPGEACRFSTSTGKWLCMPGP